MEARRKNLKKTIMAYKMKGAPMYDTSSKHGTNANYKKSGAPGFMDFAKRAMDPLGLKNKLMGGNKPCPPAGQQAAAAPAPNAPAQPAAPAPAAAAPAVPEEAAAPTMMKKGLKNGALMKKSPMEKGKTSVMGKLKALGKGVSTALRASATENVGTSLRYARQDYKKSKKESREAARNKNKKK